MTVAITWALILKIAFLKNDDSNSAISSFVSCDNDESDDEFSIEAMCSLENEV